MIHRAQASVSLNGEGYPVYGNEAVFPLGIFNGGARMREMAESGFSVTHSYNSVEAQAFGRLDDSRAKAFLDDTHRAGMKALMLLPRKALFARDWDTVRRRVLMFRNHPGLLAWDEEEGIARGDMKPETLRELAAIVKELDPHHPLMVGDSRDVIGRIAPDRANFFLDDSMDLGMWWWYPFPVSAKANALEGDEAGSPENMPLPAFMVNATTCKPLWIGIQAYKKPGASARYPTREEYRFQAYAALCAGARGLMWYGGSVTGGAYLNPKESEWEYIKSLVSELRSLEPALTGKMVKLRVEPESSAVSAVLRQGEGRTILTAVNRTTHKGEASVSVEGWVSAVRLPQGEVVRIESGVLHERFEPLGVSLYELRR